MTQRRVFIAKAAGATAVVTLALLALLLAADPSSPRAAGAPTLREGRHEGADFLIGMPAQWNGGLVMFAHGYEGERFGAGGRAGRPVRRLPHDARLRLGCLRVPQHGLPARLVMADTLALRERFIKEFGQPRWTIIHGQSMGGHVAIASLELHPEVYQGGLIECGVVDGVGLVDWLYACTAAADYLSGVRLLDTPRPGFDGLVNGTWIGLMGMPGDYTARGRRFDSVVKHMAGGDLPLRLEGLKARYLLNLNSRDPGPLRAQEFARHADTRHIRYAIDPGLGLDDETLNREIRRVTPAPGARSRETNPVFAELSGKIRVLVMTIHETADLPVPFRLQQDYRRRTLAAGTGHLLVQRAVRWAGHCAFDGVVRERAFDDLIARMERGVVLAGDDVLGDVGKLGLRWTPALHPDDPARRP